MTTPEKARYVPRLSKSRYMSGHQCHKKLWFECYEPELATPPDEAQQAIFDSGHVVGDLATKRYAGGVMIDEDYMHQSEARLSTIKAMSSGVPSIYEAGFMYENVRVRVDVLKRVGDEWDMIEVKSTLEAKPQHVRDLALQVWVARGAGIPIRRAGVLTLNRDYVYEGGDLDLDQLFKLHDRTEEIEEYFDEVAQGVAELHQMLAGPQRPEVAPGPHCFKPYNCQFYEHCTQGMVEPEHPLVELKLKNQAHAELESQGTAEVRDVPADFELDEKQARIRLAVVSATPHVDAGALTQALDSIEYPVHHFDFETVNPAIPVFEGTSPYSMVTFQWSNHIEQEDGSLKHEEFLWQEASDPRRPCIESLLESLGTEGSICVYSGFEAQRLKQLAREFPEYEKPLLALIPRLWDLLPVVRAHVYHHEFHGSFSIKRVLPALVPELTYEGMEIGDGGTASRAYLANLKQEDPTEKARVFELLAKYCEQDTNAMVKLRQALRKLARAA